MREGQSLISVCRKPAHTEHIVHVQKLMMVFCYGSCDLVPLKEPLEEGFVDLLPCEPGDLFHKA